MANEIEIDLGPPATGWTLYAVLFATDWAGNESTLGTAVWNGTAFVADAFAGRSAGAIPLVEVGTTGNFVGNAPAGITESGIYPLIGFHQLGATPNAQTDEPVTLGGSTVTIAGSSPPPPPPPPPPSPDVPSAGIQLRFDPAKAAGDDWQSMVLARGSGVPFHFVPPEAIALTAADWEFRIGTRQSPELFRFNAEKTNLTVSESGTITINPAAAETATLPLGPRVRGELWRIGPSDDDIELHALVKIIVLRSLN